MEEDGCGQLDMASSQSVKQILVHGIPRHDNEPSHRLAIFPAPARHEPHNTSAIIAPIIAKKVHPEPSLILSVPLMGEEPVWFPSV